MILYLNILSIIPCALSSQALEGAVATRLCLSAVNNPERHPALGSTHRAAAMHRLGFFVAALLRMTETRTFRHACTAYRAAVATRLCHSEPFGYAQGKLREESRATDQPGARVNTQGSSGASSGFFVAALLRMTAAAGLLSCPCRRAYRGGVGAHPRIKYGAGSEHCRRK